MRTPSYLPLAAVCFLLASCGDKTEPGLIEDPQSAGSPSGGTGTSTTGSMGSTTAVDGGTVTTTGSVPSSGTGTGSTGSKGLCGTNNTSITYDGDASVVLNSSCTSCHSPSGTQSSKPVHTKASAIATFKQFDGKGQVDSGQMPLSKKLTANQICIIDYWVEQGYN